MRKIFVVIITVCFGFSTKSNEQKELNNSHNKLISIYKNHEARPMVSMEISLLELEFKLNKLATK